MSSATVSKALSQQMQTSMPKPAMAILRPASTLVESASAVAVTTLSERATPTGALTMPSDIRLHSGSHHKTEKYRHHKDLGHATSKTAPTGHNGVGCTDNVRGKRLRAPELIGHERGASAAYEEADHVQRVRSSAEP